MKYIVAGLGNVGEEYEGTRHNTGFMVVDRLAKSAEARWELSRHAYRTEIKLKGRTIILLKPTTYMNLSGKAIKYWLMQERVELSRLLVVVDDIALPLGELRMKKQGSGGGHNGLKNIEEILGSNAYCRLRVGVGNDFARGRQIDYVLGQYSEGELAELSQHLDEAAEMVKTFVLEGADRAMNKFNGQKKQEKKGDA
ncbi:MAG: aminoacyl-tRNA hydrolase [Bacteroidales bacterium]|nr:aminoacyl-tRNA hydrolase [Bacteroidales bacterium]